MFRDVLVTTEVHLDDEGQAEAGDEVKAIGGPGAELLSACGCGSTSQEVLSWLKRAGYVATRQTTVFRHRSELGDASLIPLAERWSQALELAESGQVHVLEQNRTFARAWMTIEPGPADAAGYEAEITLDKDGKLRDALCNCPDWNDADLLGPGGPLHRHIRVCSHTFALAKVVADLAGQQFSPFK